MKLYVLFAQRRCRHAGEFAPEAVAAVTEYQDEGNEDLMPGLLHEHTAELGDDITAINWISFEVDVDAICDRLVPHERALKATLVDVNTRE